MKTKVKLKIADIVIEMQSKFWFVKPEPLQFLTPAYSARGEKNEEIDERFKNFLYPGRKKPHIRITVNIADELPEAAGKNMFITYHFQDGKENWRLSRRDSTYIYKSTLEHKEQLAIVNKNFDRADVYVLPNKKKGRVWQIEDIIYDFLQVLLINYCALRSNGIFVHGIGVKDVTGRGLLFAGKSGCGKTTTAKLWHTHSRAMVLNDDRIIVRRRNNTFFIHGSPWHGEFSDYLYSRIESAPLEKLFFIRHSLKNAARKISPKEAFSILYPALFPTFWDKENLENIASFSQELIERVDCYKLGFVNGKRVIQFVRKI